MDVCCYRSVSIALLSCQIYRKAGSLQLFLARCFLSSPQERCSTCLFINDTTKVLTLKNQLLWRHICYDPSLKQSPTLREWKISERSNSWIVSTEASYSQSETISLLTKHNTRSSHNTKTNFYAAVVELHTTNVSK